MEREQLCFVPKWEGRIEGWTKNYIRKNLWRLPRGYEAQDLLQDGYVKFLTCFKKYPEVTEPNHFMSLYKRAFANYIHDLSNYASRQTDNVSKESDSEDSEDLIETTVGEYSNDGEIRSLIQHSPPHVQQVLEVLTKPVSQSPLEAPKKYRFGTEKLSISEGGLYNRETTNERVCRVIGWDSTQIDAIGLAKGYIKRRNTYTLQP